MAMTSSGYLTLGFGSKMSEVGIYANASSVDGEYNSARLLPEMTQYGSAQLTNSKYYGTNGIESLRAVLKHADQYGLEVHLCPRPVLRAADRLCRLAQDRSI